VDFKHVCIAKQKAFAVYIVISVCLLHFKKVCVLVHFKEYCFVKQNLFKLEAEKVKIIKISFNPTKVEIVNILGVESFIFKAY